MSSTPKKAAGSNLDASTFDIDAWIDDVQRPEVTVELYPFEVDYALKVAAIEAKIPAAEKTTAEDRGLDEASAAQLLAQLAALREERARTTLNVRVRQLTHDEIKAVRGRAADAGADGGDLRYWIVAEACVEPTFTPEQIIRLHGRDLSGETMVDQLVIAVAELSKGLPVPS